LTRQSSIPPCFCSQLVGYRMRHGRARDVELLWEGDHRPTSSYGHDLVKSNLEIDVPAPPIDRRGAQPSRTARAASRSESARRPSESSGDEHSGAEDETSPPPEVANAYEVE
jgi:hypothetical protein